MANTYKVIDKKTQKNKKSILSNRKDNAIPFFGWGKYYERDGRVVMSVSVQAHHSYVDGIHIGEFADKLQKYLNEL